MSLETVLLCMDALNLTRRSEVDLTLTAEALASLACRSFSCCSSWICSLLFHFCAEAAIVSLCSLDGTFFGPDSAAASVSGVA